MRSRFLACIYLLALLFNVCAVGCSRQSDQLKDVAGVSVLEVEHGPSTTFEELAWSPNGRYMAARVYAGRGNSTVTVIDLQTGESQRLYESGGDGFHGPEWSPDGRALVFHISSSPVSPLGGGPVEMIPPYNIIVADAVTGQVIRDLGFGSYATWTNDPERIIVLGQGQGACEKEISIDEYDLASNETRTIGHTGTCWPEAIDSLDASAKGKLVVPSIDGTNNQILDIVSGDKLGAITPIRGSTVWSPDGTMLAFIAKELDSSVGTDGIMLASSNGVCFSNPLRLHSYLYSVDWSPDGSRLVFSNRDVNRLYFVDLTTGVGKELMDSYRERCTS
jgi:Tol biopolymer transport system component